MLNADGLTSKNKLEIAKKVGLSETAFVSKSQQADYKLDFFTPTKQIAHCGHATIATFSYLKQKGELWNSISSKETIDGFRQIKLSGDLAFMQQIAPSYNDINDKEAALVLKSLGVDKNQRADFPIKLVNTGNSFLIISVKSAKTLATIKPDFALIEQLSEAFDLIGYYVFTEDTESTDFDVTTRMFAPRYGILEESGTGMAAGPLACYLYDVVGVKKSQFKIQQGKFMEKPSQSLIIVGLRVANNKITSLMAGGKGVVKEQKIIEID